MVTKAKFTRYTHSEDKIQADCFFWLRNTYRRTYKLCFHIPNGGLRSGREAKKLEAMGVVAGIPDLFLAIPENKFLPGAALMHTKAYGLFIEMKTSKGNESPDQKSAHAALRAAGFRVETIRSLEEFQTLINDYLKNSDYIN